jgi:hypothetical protein
MSVTGPHGEVVVLDNSRYGAVTITNTGKAFRLKVV